MNKSRKIIFLCLSWLASFAVLVIIAWFSFQDSSESSETSKGILHLIPFYEKMPQEWLSIIHTVIRKMAHFSIYALLGFTLFNAFNLTLPIKRTFIYLISIGASSIYAFIDEFVYQAITPGRAPMITDVCIDTLGASFGAILMLFIIALIRFIKNKETSV